MLKMRKMAYLKIILVLPARLGDALFCTPAIHLLQKHWPQAQLDVLAMSAVTADMLAFNPAIKKIYTEKDDLAKLAQQYDLALNLHFEALSDQQLATFAAEAKSIEAPNIIKHQSAQALEFIQRILSCEIDSTDLPYRLFPQPEHFQAVKTKLLAQGVDLDNDILIGCHLGCHRIAGLSWWKLLKGASHKKVWPLKKFLELEATLRKENPRIRFVLTGSKSEQHLAQKFIKSAPSSINLIDKTSVLELAALMHYLKLYLTSDTGTLHVACATQVNLVALFGPTSLVRTGPYPQREHHTIIQQPRITKLKVADVKQVVMMSLRRCKAPEVIQEAGLNSEAELFHLPTTPSQ